MSEVTRITQAGLVVVGGDSSPGIRITQAGLVVVGGDSSPGIRITQAGLVVVGKELDSSPSRITQAGLVVIGGHHPGIRTTQAGMAVVVRPPYPTLIGAAIDEHHIDLTMGAGDGATAHELHRSTTAFTPSAATLLASYGATVPGTYSDTGLDAGTIYYYTLVATVASVDWSRSIAVSTLGFEKPTLYVGQIQSASAVLAVDSLPEFLEVEFQTTLGGAIVDRLGGSQTGPGRFFKYLDLLTSSTEYVSQVRVRYAGGWSEWSDAVTWSTLAGDLTDLGCPPQWQGVAHNPDGNHWDRLGRGFFRPLPGQPFSGTANIIFRWQTGATWDLYLSDDAGATYALIASGVGQSGSADGDHLIRHTFAIDTTAYADGPDYRLKAVSTDLSPAVEWESMTFNIDNAGDVIWWKAPITPDEAAADWGLIWNADSDNWVKSGHDGGIGAIEGHDWAGLANLQTPLCDGADVTVRYYIWSGEGGLFRLQGRDDVEFFDVGLAFLAGGESVGSRDGIFVGIENLQSWIAGCCSDYLTSGQASLVVKATQTPGGELKQKATESPITKMFFKAVMKPWQVIWEEQTIAGHLTQFVPNATGGSFVYWPPMEYRLGAEPSSGTILQTNTCARRWEMYSQRTRVELDPGDRSRVRIRVRLDGPGVDDPASGYWHLDEWIDFGSDWDAGAIALVSKQLAQSLYGSPAGARVFFSYSALPLNPGSLPDIPPTTLPPWYEPQEGEPCTLILLVYEEDGETVAFEVGEDELHFNPFLVWPENYGEQEVDVVNGACSIGQVECILIDKPQTAGDQDTGWLTERIGNEGVGIIQGRRNRLIRYVSPEIGWVVIADGPASAPRLDGSYAAYRWVIRDTRETERKVRAFVESDSWLLPMGLEDGFGGYTDEDGDPGWLVPPTDPLVGEYSYDTGDSFPMGVVTFYDYWSGAFFNGAPIGSPQTVDEDVVVIQAVEDALIADAEELGSPRPVLWTWPDVEIMWRVQGSGDPWTTVQPTDILPDGRNVAKPTGAGQWWRSLITAWDAELADGTEVRAVSAMRLHGYSATGSFPTDGDTIEVAVKFKGEPTAFGPLHIEGLTTGQFLRQLYDGEYSYPNLITGETLPTGIRYNEADLLKMTDPVRLRITEPIDDLRSWAETNIYAPTGWAPALDNDGAISPKSQVPPADFSGELLIDNDHTEPQPDWGAGERVVNGLKFVYPRLYPVEVGDAESIDRLEVRDITEVFRDPDSQALHGDQFVSYDGSAFAAIGDEYAEPVLGKQVEYGYIHAQNRNTYILLRYKDGAPIIEVPVMRTHCATIRAGDWVRIDLSWFPNYTTRERGMLCGAQVLAVHDVDCAWRILLLEKVEPYTEIS